MEVRNPADSKPAPQPEIFTVTRRIAHHASRTGYDLLAEVVGSPVTVPSWVSKLRGLGPAQRFWRKRSGMEWYNGFYLEFFTALHMQKRKGAIYHFLYGENEFRFLPSLTKPGRNKIVCTFHAPPQEFARVMKYTDHLRHVDAAIAVASNQTSMLEQLFGKERVSQVPVGVDTAYYSPAAAAVTSKSCLVVGHHHRDLDTLCKTAEILRRKDPAVRLTLIDRVFSVYRTPQDQRQYLDWFHSVGNIQLRMDVSDTELLSLYRSSELMMLPLTDTTANLAVLEGLSCGLPQVVTDIGGIRDYVDSDCAALVAPQDAETMAEQVLRILNDRARRNAMAQAARAKALTFDWHVIAEQMTKVYESVANLASRMR